MPQLKGNPPRARRTPLQKDLQAPNAGNTHPATKTTLFIDHPETIRRAPARPRRPRDPIPADDPTPTPEGSLGTIPSLRHVTATGVRHDQEPGSRRPADHGGEPPHRTAVRELEWRTDASPATPDTATAARSSRTPAPSIGRARTRRQPRRHHRDRPHSGRPVTHRARPQARTPTPTTARRSSRCTGRPRSTPTPPTTPLASPGRQRRTAGPPCPSSTPKPGTPTTPRPTRLTVLTLPHDLERKRVKHRWE
ncbi:hypothetical protein SAMN05443665_101242 [Actinomadura meyerae]|uniref:Uncharacterized protein n=1 Tax=Actinomadura meyerae TaxID=240840 RepID=A0A239IB64_9ACTN|nr:hypothetical protein SAMN05443665_101242 [Actinomadura meyerae]